MKDIKVDNKEMFDYLQKISDGCKKLERLSGSDIVIDGELVVPGIDSGKTIISETDEEAVDEYRYQLMKSGRLDVEQTEKVALRYARDTLKRVFGG